MIAGAQSTYGLGADFVVQLAVLVVLTALATRLYPTIAQ
jgi:hypothetical protein